MVTAMDDAVGQVIAALKSTGHYENSVIVFTADVSDIWCYKSIVKPFFWQINKTTSDSRPCRKSLTLYLMNSFFRRFSGHSLRQALFVYRLIVATLIGNFFDDPFLN